MRFLRRTAEAVGWGRSRTGVIHVDELSRCDDSGGEGQPGEHYIISAGDLTTLENV